ncbi:MAG: ribosomal protein S18-alanine N-acetyltransferase [Clostridia bacterium]|nr:ribosomal protein S18-alanine N-acetyltransferase [Clostridia bacterium]
MIAPLTERDLAAVAAIERECFSSPWSEEMLASSLRGGTFVILGEWEGDRLKGYLNFYLIPPTAEIGNLAVTEHFRRQGVARRLLLFAFDYLKEKGLTSISLEVRSKNTNAIALYTSLGFVPEGVRPRYYGDDDAIILWKYFD